jgi:hypothetical protein
MDEFHAGKVGKKMAHRDLLVSQLPANNGIFLTVWHACGIPDSNDCHKLTPDILKSKNAQNCVAHLGGQPA